MNRMLRYALALAHAAIEYARIEGDRIVIEVRPHKRSGLRCPVCGRRCACCDASPEPRRWRAMDLARSMCFLEYSVLAEAVP